VQEALDPRSNINQSGADAALIAVDHRWFRLDHNVTLDPDRRLAEAVELLSGVIAALKRNSASTIILQTLPIPPLPLFGNFDAKVPGSLRWLVSRLNTEIIGLAAETASIIFDVAALAEQVGSDLWFDPMAWNLYKIPFSSRCNAIYADHVARILGSLIGKARKCLVLDLDNTIWGGVIGDDGIEALKIGEGSAEGEAFLSVQRMALNLKERGIVLAASSKNDEAVARKPFHSHPDMLLREEDIAVFQANWLDKPSNLEAIAKFLNIGIDALVFLDDNAAERAEVRAALPTVAVPELPDDPAWYPWFLSNAGYFEAVTFSNEDRIRAQSYAANAQRALVETKARDLGDYLASLDIEVQFAPFDAIGRSRISQLINKSNQFNLTTKRYTENDVEAFEQDEHALTLQVRLRDRFGDFGMIAVVIGLASDSATKRTLTMDTWLMSCRVLGRQVEEAMLREIVRQAKQRGVVTLIGTYLPTDKNGMVANHYPKLGFSEMERHPDGVRTYALDVDAYVPVDLPVRITLSKQSSDVGLTAD